MMYLWKTTITAATQPIIITAPSNNEAITQHSTPKEREREKCASALKVLELFFLCIAFIAVSVRLLLLPLLHARFFLVSFPFLFTFHFISFWNLFLFFGNFWQLATNSMSIGGIANGNGNKPYSLALKLLLFTWGERNNNNDACCVCISDTVWLEWRMPYVHYYEWESANERNKQAKKITTTTTTKLKKCDCLSFLSARKFKQKNVKF